MNGGICNKNIYRHRAAQLAAQLAAEAAAGPQDSARSTAFVNDLPQGAPPEARKPASEPAEAGPPSWRPGLCHGRMTTDARDRNLQKTTADADDPGAAATSTSRSRTASSSRLIGPSGCGKTTALRIVTGLLDRTAGEVFVDGKPSMKPSRDKAIVFQLFNLFPWRTALENVAYGLELQRVPKKQRLARRRGVPRPRRPLRPDAPLPVAALRRPEPAGRARARARDRAEADADGRAVRLARRAHARAPPGDGAEDLRREGPDRALRHALGRRGDLPLRPHRRHGLAGPRRRRVHGRPAAGRATSTTGVPTTEYTEIRGAIWRLLRAELDDVETLRPHDGADVAAGGAIVRRRRRSAGPAPQLAASPWPFRAALARGRARVLAAVRANRFSTSFPTDIVRAASAHVRAATSFRRFSDTLKGFCARLRRLRRLSASRSGC